MMVRQPALFVGHGSPMTVITDNPAKAFLARLGAALPRPRAILCISAHWETSGAVHLTEAGAPRTVHDFGGFPQALFDWRYPAQGPDWLVERVAELVGEERVRRDGAWGYDHGTWGVLDLLFPGEYLPTVAMSLDRGMDGDGLIALGRALAPLRDEGVLIVGSGNVVHNLSLYRQTIGTVPDWADEFRQRISRAVEAQDDAALTRFAADDRAAAAAINSAEHYLPLLVAVGARMEGDAVGVFNDTIDGALSMTSYLLGDAAVLNGI
jgi:4,5-DOPA dioxygenase extradiol